MKASRPWSWLLVLVRLVLGAAARKEMLPFDGDTRLAVHRHGVDGTAAPENARDGGVAAEGGGSHS